MDFNETVKLRQLYQNAQDTSPHWRQGNRIYHPLTERQFKNKFKVGDRVTMRLIDPTKKTYITAIIVNIIRYDTCVQFIGQYNIDSAFNQVPFTHALVLGPV